MSILTQFRASARVRAGEVNNAPSMTEDAHILSVQQIFKDFCRGIIHNECYRHAFYDDGNDMDMPDDFNDLTDLGDTQYERAKRSDPSPITGDRAERSPNNEGSEGDPDEDNDPERSEGEADEE